jgi:ElaA protein
VISSFADLSTIDLYRILKLRCDVFVVEQHCPYPELDGRDTEPETLHLWLEAPDGSIAAYLRVLAEPDGSARIGRVVTAPAARGQGLAGKLLAAALDQIGPGRAAVLDAQTVATGLYSRFGFTVTGPAYDDDGIEHVPMLRPSAAA